MEDLLQQHHRFAVRQRRRHQGRHIHDLQEVGQVGGDVGRREVRCERILIDGDTLRLVSLGQRWLLV